MTNEAKRTQQREVAREALYDRITRLVAEGYTSTDLRDIGNLCLRVAQEMDEEGREVRSIYG